MSIITSNLGPPHVLPGGWVLTGFSNGFYYIEPVLAGAVVNTAVSPQVAGLVPVFPCVGTECREGKYGADTLADDTQFMLPVFAQNPVPAGPIDTYFNDYNSFLFNFASMGVFGSNHTYYLDHQVNGVWTQLAILTNNTYGTMFGPNVLCSGTPWQGFQVSWPLVLAAFGEGVYRFRLVVVGWGVQDSKGTQCFQSPPFCLKTWSCYAADRTVKWEATYSGGRIGSIDKTNCGGNSWTFCCDGLTGTLAVRNKPILWNDSIRFEGFFGKEQNDYEVKDKNGVVNRLRSEEILKFSLQTGNLPMWAHQRFKAYGCFADTLLVNDYNINNTAYDFKHYCVLRDSSYSIDYKGYTRYPKAKMDFKPQTQFIARTKCC
jgi:hypothetical protein